MTKRYLKKQFRHIRKTIRRLRPSFAFWQEVHLPCKISSSGEMLRGELPDKIRGFRTTAKKGHFHRKMLSDKKLLKYLPSGRTLVENFLRKTGLKYMGATLSGVRLAGTLFAGRIGGERPDYVAYNFAAAEAACHTTFGHAVPPDATYSKAFLKPHHYEGRIVILGFPAFDVVSIYGCFSSFKKEVSGRRIAWDNNLHHFVERCSIRNRRLVILGDLNVAPTGADVSCARRQGHCPGFKKGERVSFREIVAAGGLVDAYRHCHPASHNNGLLGYSDFSSLTRSLRSGMRLDHCFVSKELLKFVVSCDIVGNVHDDGSFSRKGTCGSDHFPVIVRMRAGCTRVAPPVQKAGGGK